MNKVEFFKHNISQTDIDNLNKVLNSVFLTTGDAVSDFENAFSRYLKCRRTVGVTSCTAAMHLALLGLGIGPGDEVITTPMTFIATANTIIQAGATPVLVDAETETANINASLIEKAITRKTRAIMPVHMYGQLCDMKAIKHISDKHHLKIVEDAAHTIEAVRDGVRPGQLGDAACYSFYTTKSITCGEGGAISTNDDDLAEKLIVLRLHGMNKDAAKRYIGLYQHWEMETLGWKYNMSNIQAALLNDQLTHIDEFQKRRETIIRAYEAGFSGNPRIRLLKSAPGSKSACLMFTILVSPEKRDTIMHKIQEKGVGIAVNYRAIHILKYYRETFGFKRGDFPVAENIGDSTITLPLYPKLTDEEVQYVIKAVNESVM
jgi:dTDP-4-amino-4,6-dideoxygalactose transaminase